MKNYQRLLSQLSFIACGLGLLFAVAPVHVNGQILAYDGFSALEYMDGAILGGQNGGKIDGTTSWPREIQAGTRIKSIADGGLTYADLQTTPGGTGGIFYDGSGFDAGFTRNALYTPGPNKPAMTNTTVYGSFLLRFGQPIPEAPVIPNFFEYKADGVDLTDGFNTSLYFLRNVSADSHTQLSLAIGSSTKIVGQTTRLDLSKPLLVVFALTNSLNPSVNDTLAMYFNPTNLANIPGTAQDQILTSEAEAGVPFPAIAGLYFKSGMRDNQIDEIRFAWGSGATMEMVAPQIIPEPSCFVFTGLLVLLTIRTSYRKGIR